ncbi:hypothetical protein PTKIN_Ptkin14bG0214200 [Pterospermum kingtungense]
MLPLNCKPLILLFESASHAYIVNKLLKCGGVFDKFKSSDGKWKETIIEDVRGLLSLYEAANLRVHGESILEEALAFTKANLKSLAMKSSPHLSKQIMNALDQPLNKCPPRLATRNYISFFEEEESRNETLLKFAKLDFNRVQLLHQQEISEVVRNGTNCMFRGNSVAAKNPKIVKALNFIGRLMDDLKTHKFEQLRGHCPSSIECYMKQHNLSEEAALKDFEKMLDDAWKDMHEELCSRPTAVPRDILLVILTLLE